MAEIITSNAGGKKLLLNGHIYYRKSSAKGNTYWRCQRSGECSATKAAPKKKWLDTQIRVRRVVAAYATYKDDDIIGFLRTLGHHFVL